MDQQPCVYPVFPSRGFKGFGVAIGVVAAIYAVVLWILPPNVFWSPDEGGKFLQMSGWRAGGPSEYRISYPGHIKDAEYRFYPKRAMYPQPSANGTVSFGWHPWFPLLSLLPYGVFGIRGIYVPPALASIFAAIIAGLAAQRLQPGSWPWVVFGVALAGPMLFYGVLFWEHTLAVCLGLAAVYLSIFTLREGSPASQYAKAGVALGLLAVAVSLRFEMVILPVALFVVACGSAVAHRQSLLLATIVVCHRTRIWLPVVVTALAAVVGVAVLDGWFGGHFSFPGYSVDLTCRALSRLGEAGLWREIPAFVVGALVNTSEESGIPLPEIWLWVGLLGLGFCILSCAPVGRLRFWLWMIGAIMLAWVSWRAVSLPERYRAVHSLFLPAPFLVLALLPLSRSSPRPPARAFLEAVTALYLGLYLVLAFLICGVQGGAEWGSRYALVLYPLLVILGGVRCQTFFASPETGAGRRTAVKFLACGLLALGLLFSVRGVREIRTTKQDLSAFSREVRVGGQAVVTDHWWLSAALAPTFAEQELYTVSGEGELDVWIRRVGRQSKHFTYASYGAGPADEPALGLRLEGSKMVNGMNFSRYEVIRP